MGFGLGCLGLSFADWCGLSPAEFAATCKAYREEQDFKMRDAWERARLMTANIVQPHVIGRLKPEQVMHFPWDEPKKKNQGGKNEGGETTPPVSRDEQKRRFAELVGKMKNG